MGLRLRIVGFDPGDKHRRMAAMLEDPEDLLNAAGVALSYVSAEAFVNQSFNGVPWAKRMTPNWPGIIRDLMGGSSRPKSRRLKPGPALNDTGVLKGSMAFNRIDRTAIIYGSNVSYAEKQAAGLPSEVGPWDEGVRAKLWAWLKTQEPKTKDDLRWLLSVKWTKEGIEVRPTARQFVGMTPEVVESVETTLAEA